MLFCDSSASKYPSVYLSDVVVYFDSKVDSAIIVNGLHPRNICTSESISTTSCSSPGRRVGSVELASKEGDSEAHPLFPSQFKRDCGPKAPPGGPIAAGTPIPPEQVAGLVLKVRTMSP